MVCAVSTRRMCIGFLVQVADNVLNYWWSSGAGSTERDDGDLQAPFFHNPTQMTHLGSSQTTWIGEQLLGSPPCFVPSPFQDDRLACLCPFAKRKQLVFGGLGTRSSDPSTSITQALSRTFPQTLETNPRRKGNDSLKDWGPPGFHRLAKPEDRSLFRNTQHTH